MTCPNCDILYEKITRDSREAFEVLRRLCCESDAFAVKLDTANETLRVENTRLHRYTLKLNAENAELKAQIDAIKATDHATVIDALLEDKTNLKYALSSIGDILKVAEKL